MKKRKHLQFGKSVFLIILSALLAFDMIFGCWEMVYAAQDSLPGDLLYAVKLTREDLQLAFTSDTQARIRLLTTFADLRAEEATTLVSQGQPIPDELSTLMGGYLEELIVLTSSVDVVAQQEVLEGVQRHLRPRDQDQGMTGPKNSSVHNDENPPPRDMKKNGKGQDSVDISLEISTISITSEISATQTITPGTYGPGPCVVPDCTTPLAEEHSPGAYLGIAPGSENHEGYGPGFDQGQGSQQTAPSGSNGNSNNPQGQGGQP